MSVFEDAIRSAAGNMTPDNDENPMMDCNAIIIRHGYHPGRNGSGSFGWMMRPI